jgi:hypothetical protein
MRDAWQKYRICATLGSFANIELWAARRGSRAVSSSCPAEVHLVTLSMRLADFPLHLSLYWDILRAWHAAGLPGDRYAEERWGSQ